MSDKTFMYRGFECSPVNESTSSPWKGVSTLTRSRGDVIRAANSARLCDAIDAWHEKRR